MADTMGTKEASELWGYSQSTISEWCRSGMFGDDAWQDAYGSPWHIRKTVKCPRPPRKLSEYRREENGAH